MGQIYGAAAKKSTANPAHRIAVTENPSGGIRDWSETS
jgi:hypothetical protein